MSKVDGGGLRYNSDKIEISMTPNSLIYAVSKCFEYGAKKYAKDNWRRGMNWSIPYNCAMRHMMKFWEGEDLDEETGLSNLYHVACNVAMLIEYIKTCPELDDRFKQAQVTYNEVKGEGNGKV